MGVFGEHAQSYWDAGLQAIPLYKDQKRPSVNDWQRFAGEAVSIEEQQAWLATKAEGNIGLALGAASGVCMVDIDTDDERVIAILRTVLPPSPWLRRGKKGYVLAYRFSGLRTFRVKKSAKETLVEVLSTGAQVVLPPSIHPETKLAYMADTDLFDPVVLASLVMLPRDIEAILRGALQHEGIKLSLSGHTKVVEWVSSGSRDTKMIQLAGFFSRGILKGDISFKQAINDMHSWEMSQVESVAGDEVDINKGISTMAKFLVNDVFARNRSLPVDWDLDLTSVEKIDLGLDKFDEIHTPWDFDRCKEHIKGEFMVHDVGTLGRKRAIDFILARIANAGLTPLEEARLIDYIAAVGQMGDKSSTLKTELKRLRSSGITGDDQTQIAKAMIDDLKAEGELRFRGGHFWQWQGSHWEKLEASSISKIIADKYGKLPMAKRSGDHAGILKIMTNQVDGQLKETSEIGVNFANGWLDEALVLRPHDPMYGCTYTLPYRYMPEGSTEMGAKFRGLIERCWKGDDDIAEKTQSLQEAISVTLFGHAVALQRAFCLLGLPKSGKSQFIKVIEHLVPQECQAAVKPEDWGDKFLPAELFGKLLNSCSELSEKKKIDGAKFKEIISGELQTVQFKHQAPFKFAPTCAHWFASNHTPKTDDTSEAFNRRWMLLTFNNIISDAERVLDLGTIIAAEERETIASWAVQTFPALLRKKDYTLSSSHHERMEEIAKSNNSLLQFVLDGKTVLIENTLGSSPTRIAEADLYSAYFTFAIAAGVAKVVPSTTFRQKMREVGQLHGFRTVIERNSSGGQECFYENLTFAKSNVARLRRLSGT